MTFGDCYVCEIGRTYNRRTVVASFYPEERFDMKDYLIRS